MQVPAIDQRFVEVQEFPGAAEGGYDACWDVLAIPGGRVYAGCGCEDGNCLSVRLFAYDIPTQKMIFLFDAADVTHTPPGAIPQSKVHTSMARMEDGRLIMCTHSTARAPCFRRSACPVSPPCRTAGWPSPRPSGYRMCLSSKRS